MGVLGYLTLAVTLQLCLAGPVLVPENLVGLQPNTPENIYKFQNLGPNDFPEELSGQFQGDITLTQEQLDYINAVQIDPNTVMVDPNRHWPHAVVPYEIPPGVYTADEIAKIEKALFNIEYFTCFRFVKRTQEVDYVTIENPGGRCSSFLGRVGGKQVMNLSSPGCVNFATVIHEFLHAIGIHHMQSDSDRDRFVRINMDNVQEGMEHNFVKISASDWSQFGVPYDFTSVMHYSEFAFAVNPNIPTIVSLTGDEIRPTRDTWSWMDIERINRAFCGKQW